jgi:hypothetical protein
MQLAPPVPKDEPLSQSEQVEVLLQVTQPMIPQLYRQFWLLADNKNPSMHLPHLVADAQSWQLDVGQEATQVLLDILNPL